MATHSCSCLENPRDGGAWWAAVYEVTQSRTRLKRLSSSSSSRLASRVTDCLKIQLGSKNKYGSQMGSSKRRWVQTMTMPGLPCPCRHVTVAGALQRKTHTPSLRGWGWGIKDGSRLPSPRLFSFSGQGLGHSRVLRTESKQEVGRKEKGQPLLFMT